MKIFLCLLLLLALAAGFVLVMYLKRARAQHYVFAHTGLPTQFFHHSKDLLDPLFAETAAVNAACLRQYWLDLDGGIMNDHDRVGPAGLSHQFFPWNQRTHAFLVTLPQPAVKPEAYFALMLFDKDDQTVEGYSNQRYFVLEYHGLKNQHAETLIGEWSPKDGENFNYQNHDKNVQPTTDAFIAAVRRITQT